MKYLRSYHKGTKNRTPDVSSSGCPILKLLLELGRARLCRKNTTKWYRSIKLEYFAYVNSKQNEVVKIILLRIIIRFYRRVNSRNHDFRKEGCIPTPLIA